VSKKTNTIITEDKYVWRKIAAVLSGLLVVFLVLQVFALKAEIAEIKETTDKAQEATGYIMDFGTDLNEIRELLLLPTENYATLNGDDIETEDEGDTVIEDMFAYVHQIGVSKTIEENTTQVDEYLSTEEIGTLLQEQGLSRADGEYEIKDALDRALLRVGVSEEDGAIYLQNYFDEDIEINGDLSVAFESEIANMSALTARIDVLDNARTELSSMLYESGDAYDALMEKGMKAEAEYDNGSSYDYYLVNQDQTRLATLTLAKASPEVVTWSDLTTGDMAPVEIDAAVLAALIEPLDASTLLEQKVAENREKLESLLSDAAFTKALSENSVEMSEAREDDTGIYYDLLALDGSVLSTIYVDKHTGKVMVTNGETKLELMAAVQEAESKKKTLLCLKHSRNMMS